MELGIAMAIFWLFSGSFPQHAAVPSDTNSSYYAAGLSSTELHFCSFLFSIAPIASKTPLKHRHETKTHIEKMDTCIKHFENISMSTPRRFSLMLYSLLFPFLLFMSCQ